VKKAQVACQSATAASSFNQLEFQAAGKTTNYSIWPKTGSPSGITFNGQHKILIDGNVWAREGSSIKVVLMIRPDSPLTFEYSTVFSRHIRY